MGVPDWPLIKAGEGCCLTGVHRGCGFFAALPLLRVLKKPWLLWSGRGFPLTLRLVFSRPGYVWSLFSRSGFPSW